MKNKKKFVNEGSSAPKSPLQILLIPISIVLAGVLIMVAILISATAILDRDQLVTKSTLKATLEEALKAAGATTGTTTDTTATPSMTATDEQVKGLFTSDHLTFGNKDSKVTFVEFSDPSCPYCHIAGGHNRELNKSAGAQFTLVADGGTYVAPVPEMKKLVDEGKASFVWVYSNGHGNGELGSQAFYCAQEKGKFWEVHDLLMSNAGYDLLNNTVKNDKAQSGTLAEFLKDKVDSGFMKSCLESGKYASKLTRDEQVASAFGSQGTPGFFVNTTGYSGAYSFKDMQSAVDSALNS